MAIVLMISLGVSLASYGELAFSVTGFLIQCSAVLVRGKIDHAYVKCALTSSAFLFRIVRSIKAGYD